MHFHYQFAGQRTSTLLCLEVDNTPQIEPENELHPELRMMSPQLITRDVHSSSDPGYSCPYERCLRP